MENQIVNSETKTEKITKILLILCGIIGVCSLVLFLPQVRKMIIAFGEKVAGKSLTHDFWNKLLKNMEIEFFGLCLIIFIFLHCFSRLYLASKKSNKSIYQIIIGKIQNVSVNDWLHYIAFIFFALSLCVIHFCLVEGGDDVNVFNHALSESSYIDFLKTRYNNWSSRLIIESVLINVYHLHFGLWRLLDVLAFIVIAESMILIAFPKDFRKYSFIVYATILIFIPYHSLKTAGWGATTVNYLWPLAAAIPSFVVAKKIFANEKLKKIESVISLLVLIFAINQEQVAALVFGLNISFLIFRIVQNRKFEKTDFYFAIAIILSLLAIIFILTCPGNEIRFYKEVTHWFPEYLTLSFFDKIQLGIITICTYYFSFREKNFVLVPLCIVLSLIFYKKNKKLFLVQIFLDIFVVFSFFLRTIKKIVKIDFLITNNKLSQFSNHSWVAIIIECVILLLIALCFLYQVFAVMKNKKDGLFNSFLLCAGFCSAFIIAFSPTVYASGSRCYLFFTAILFLVTFRCFYDFKA